MKGRNVFPEGWMIILISFNWLQTITQNLDEMTWALKAYTMDGDAFLDWGKSILADLADTFQKPMDIR